MTVFTITKEMLTQLPEPILKKMDEVGLRNTLEALLDDLGSKDFLVDDDTTPILQLMDYAFAVFSDAYGPLTDQSFQHLNTHFNQFSQYVRNRDWHNSRNLLHPLLQELSLIPTMPPDRSLKSAQTLNAELADARRKLTTSITEMRKEQKEAADSFKRSATKDGTAVTQQATELRDEFARLKVSATAEHSKRLQEMADLLADLQERYGFTAEQVLGGAHELAANEEHESAEMHGKWSRWSMWGAVAWAALAQIIWLTPLAPDWDQWLDVLRSVPIIGSPVVILLFIAKREGRVALEHRGRHERLQSLALQFKSWQPYLNTLSENVREDLERKITPRLFVGDTSGAEPSD